MLERSDWHGRLVNGSDYPLSGVMSLFSTRLLTEQGYVTEPEAAVISAIRPHNPLLFDFVLKRTLRLSRKQFGHDVFESRRVFDRSMAV